MIRTRTIVSGLDGETGTFNFFAFAGLAGTTFLSQAIRGTDSVRVVA